MKELIEKFIKDYTQVVKNNQGLDTTELEKYYSKVLLQALTSVKSEQVEEEKERGINIVKVGNLADIKSESAEEIEKFIEKTAERLTENCDRDKSNSQYIHESEVYNAIVDAMNKMHDFANADKKQHAIGFSDWKDNLKPRDMVSLWSKNGEYKGLFTMDNEQLYDKYNAFLKEKEGE